MSFLSNRPALFYALPLSLLLCGGLCVVFARRLPKSALASQETNAARVTFRSAPAVPKQETLFAAPGMPAPAAPKVSSSFYGPPEPPPLPALHTFPKALAVIECGAATKKEIALTFDDGPHPPFAPLLLDKLRELNVKATFFVVGEKVDAAPEWVTLMVQDGHEVANHTYHHLNLKTIPMEFVKTEIEQGNQAIEKACGVRPVFFRPPGGQYDKEVLHTATGLGMITALWTTNPADYAQHDPDVIRRGILKTLRPGGIILLHSGIEATLQMLPELVAQLRRDGYTFVTLSEMAQHNGLLPKKEKPAEPDRLAGRNPAVPEIAPITAKPNPLP